MQSSSRVLVAAPRTLRGFDFVVDSSIPAGGGASSSSALVVLASAAVRDVNKYLIRAYGAGAGRMPKPNGMLARAG